MIITKQILKNGDAGVEQTIKLMIDYVKEYKNNIQIRNLINRLTDNGNNCNAKFNTIKNIFNYVVKNINYSPDPKDVELVKSVKHTILGNKKYGDCDDLSTALATLLYSAGYSIWFRVVAWKKEQGNAFSHVYCIIELPCHKYVMPIDPSMSFRGFGKEVNYFRKKDYKI